jgi:hypothetical protein
MSTISRGRSCRSFGIPAILIFCAMLGSCDQPKAEQSKAKPTGAPKLEVVGGDVVDWGKVAPAVLKKKIQIVNAGGDSLRIDKVQPSCGCTIAQPDRKVLGPGDTANVEVSVDVAHASGPQHKSLTITSNDAARPSMQVSLQATLVTDLTAEPRMFPASLSGKPAVVGEEYMTYVLLKNTSEQSITVNQPMIMEGVPAVIRFEPAADLTLAPGDTVRVVAHVKPLKEGPINTEVIIPNSSKSTPEMKIPLAMNVEKKG